MKFCSKAEKKMQNCNTNCSKFVFIDSSFLSSVMLYNYIKLIYCNLAASIKLNISIIVQHYTPLRAFLHLNYHFLAFDLVTEIAMEKCVNNSL